MLRRLVFNLHMLVGLAAAVIIFIQGMTGAVLVYENELNRWLNHDLLVATVSGPMLTLNQVKAAIEAAHPGYTVTEIQPPPSPTSAGAVGLVDKAGRELDLTYDPYTGHELGSIARYRRQILFVHQLHTHLAFRGGGEVMGWASVLLLLLSISGIYLWWPRKILQVSWSVAARRWFDLHNAVGFYSAIFLFVFALTGVVIHFGDDVAWFKRMVGSNPPVHLAQASEVAEGSTLADPERMKASAEAAAPGARLTALDIALDGRQSRAVLKFPEDKTPLGRTIVMLDSRTGAALTVADIRKAPAGFRFVRMWNREIHTGEVFGWPTRVIAFLSSLSLCVLTFTGPLLWWQARRRAARA